MLYNMFLSASTVTNITFLAVDGQHHFKEITVNLKNISNIDWTLNTYSLKESNIHVSGVDTVSLLCGNYACSHSKIQIYNCSNRVKLLDSSSSSMIQSIITLQSPNTDIP